MALSHCREQHSVKQDSPVSPKNRLDSFTCGVSEQTSFHLPWTSHSSVSQDASKEEGEREEEKERER